MIVDFTLKNFRSFKEEFTLSMLAAHLKDEKPGSVFDVPGEENISLLKSAVIYGPNASGKSNLVSGLAVLRQLILKSIDLKLADDIPYYDPYRLDENNLDAPTQFEIEFIAGDGNRYTFSVAYDNEIIHREELVFYPNKQIARLYLRERGKEVKFGSQFKGKRKSLARELLPNHLFLSKAANSNHEQMIPVYLYFKKNFRFHAPGVQVSYTTSRLLDDNDMQFRKKLADFLSAADTGIHSVDLEPDFDPEDTMGTGAFYVAESPKRPSLRPVILHKAYDGEKETGLARFTLAQESNGTVKMFELAGKIIAALEEGSVLVLDELDSSFHTLISQYVLELFNNPVKNPKNAQLIVTTHDVSLLGSRILRRDQVYFTSKTPMGVTDVFSLDEFDKNEVRKNTSFDKWYLNGRFGALPLINKDLFNVADVSDSGDS